MQIVVLDSSQQKPLDQFVGEQMGSPVEQSWAWGVFQTQVPGRPDFRVFAAVEEKGDVRKGLFLATLLVIRQEMGYGKTWLWAPRGPVFNRGLNAKRAQEALGLLLIACRNWARLNGDVHLRVEPCTPPEGLEWGGLRGKESYTPIHSLVLDLALEEEKILEQMSQKGRYNIKLAEKKGVAVRVGTKMDLKAFHSLLKETGWRDGFAVHPLEFYESFLQALGPLARLYVAEYKGRVVSGLLATFFGDTVTYYYGASSNEDRQIMAPYLLQWRAIQDAKKKGYKTYDFFGIAPEGDALHAWTGVTQFKTRFGGKRVEYPDPRIFVYRWIWWMLYSLRRARFFSSRS